MTSVLRVEGVTAGYTRAPVLRDVTLDVGDEIVALLGANGAGKTTLLRVVSGLLRPESGTVSLDGVALARRPPWARVRAGLAHVPEGRRVFRAMTVADNLAVAALAGGRRTQLLDEVYDVFPRLHERRSQAAGSLSGGEQQMLAIGRAMVTAPRVLCIDEMSAGLAPVTARLLVESLRAIHARGIAVLLVEQSPQLVLDAVDRVYVLDRGTIARSGTLEQIGGREGLADVYLGQRRAG